MKYLRERKKKYDRKIQYFKMLRRMSGNSRKRSKYKRQVGRKTNQFTFTFRVDKPSPRKKGIKPKPYTRVLEQRQKLRMFASQMTLRQFRRISFKLSNLILNTNYFFYAFEARLDVFLYRMNFFVSSYQCRQVINHGFVKVNDFLITLPSFKIGKFNFVSFLNSKKAFSILKLRFKKYLIFCNLPFYILTNFRIMLFIFVSLPTTRSLYFFPLRLKHTFQSLRKRFAFY